jgi:anti-anti-sigma factor
MSLQGFDRLARKGRPSDDVAMTMSLQTDIATTQLGVVVATVVISGEVDLSNADQLTSEVRHVLEAEPTQVRLDFSQTTFLDSSGLRAIIASENLVGDANARFLLLGMSPAVETVLEITGLLERYRSAGEADEQPA